MNDAKKSDHQLAQVLKSKKNEIIDLWRKKVREINPAARKKSEPALIESLPIFMDEIINNLINPKSKEKLIQISQIHGEERSKTKGYTLYQVIAEYNVLRIVIFDVIDPGNKMTLNQAKILWNSIFEAITNSSLEFSKKRENEIKFSSIINAVRDYAIFTLDLDGFIQSWNDGAYRMKGYTQEEAIGKNFSMLYTEEERKRNEHLEHLKMAKTEGRFREEGLRVRKNGEIFLADVYILPFKNNHEVIGFAKIVQDLSEYNQLLQEYNLSKAEAIDLKNENISREDFVMSLSHDLRNPLAAAKMSAQLILRNSIDREKTISLANKIVNHINRTDQMISNLLDANKLRAGEMLSINKVNCNLMKVIEEVVEEASTIYGNKMIVKGPKSLEGFWDCEALRRVIENLVNNAIKYGEIEKPITVSLEKKDSEALIRVHNFGKQINPSEQVSLFRKFHQLNGEKRKKSGWGLGLTIVKGLVEAHNAKVLINSSLHGGTTFSVEMPINSTIN